MEIFIQLIYYILLKRNENLVSHFTKISKEFCPHSFPEPSCRQEEIRNPRQKKLTKILRIYVPRKELRKTEYAFVLRSPHFCFAEALHFVQGRKARGERLVLKIGASLVV